MISRNTFERFSSFSSLCVGGRIVTLVALCLLCVNHVAFAQSTTRPNIVLFLVDDLGWVDNSLAYSRQLASERGDTDTFFETPSLEALAAAGKTFTRAYTASPVCSPTRASLLLGQSPATHRMTQYLGGPQTTGFTYTSALPTSQTTIAEALRNQAGYDTAFVGKWHVGTVQPTSHGFNSNAGGSNSALPTNWFAGTQGGFTWTNGLPQDGPAYANEYLTDRLTREAVEVIDRADQNDQPLFLAMWHYGVHVPYAAPAPLIAKYQAKIDSGQYAKFAGLTAAQKVDVATYAAMMDSVDQSLGTIRAELATRGMADNTLFVFASDNGGLATSDFGEFADSDMNGPLRNGKGTLYEGGIRTPLVVAGPNISPADNIETPVISQDLFNTLLSYADLPLPNQRNDGVNLRPVFESQPSPVQPAPARGANEIVIHYPHTSNQGGTPTGAIIDGDWKLIQNYTHGGVELFNLASDEAETTDVEAASGAKAEELRSRLHRYLADRNAPLPTGFTLDPRNAGAPMAVNSGNFEDVLPPNTLPTGWRWMDGRSGVFSQTTSSAFGSSARDGASVAILTNPTSSTPALVGIEQTLPEPLRAGTEYTVRFAAAISNSAATLDGAVRLLVGNTLLGEFDTNAVGTTSLRDLQFTLPAVKPFDPRLGQPIRIQLLARPGQTIFFDNIRVYARTIAIPEPTARVTLVVATFALALALHFKWR